MAKVLILPDYNGQDLPSEGLDRYEHIYLVTEEQESLPVPVVMKLMKLMQQSHVNIEFLELSYNSETELLLSMAFQIAKLNMAEPDVQITFVTENLIFDTLVATAKQNNFKVQRAKGFNSPSAIPTGPSEVQKPVQPSQFITDILSRFYTDREHVSGLQSRQGGRALVDQQLLRHYAMCSFKISLSEFMELVWERTTLVS